MGPGALDFSTQASQDCLVLCPSLKQVSFIGDGLTSGNVSQEAIVPAGATRLFLGTMDGWEWNNNIGAFEVAVLDPPPDPQFVPQGVLEPASPFLLVSGLVGIASLAVRRPCRP